MTVTALNVQELHGDAALSVFVVRLSFVSWRDAQNATVIVPIYVFDAFTTQSGNTAGNGSSRTAIQQEHAVFLIYFAERNFCYQSSVQSINLFVTIKHTQVQNNYDSI